MKDLHSKILDQKINDDKYKYFFQCNSGDLAYIVSLLTSQIRTSSRKVAINYKGPPVIYKIIDPHIY